VKYVIPAICLIFTIPALYVTLYVRAKTSAATPWIAVVVGMILVAIGFVFSIYSENHKVPQVD
jgi:lipopolysaccharide export LptBFGC system permease protein LptF